MKFLSIVKQQIPQIMRKRDIVNDAKAVLTTAHARQYT
jgi:hypothetical protein